MPKCLECGFEAPRLQWTHFKNKCTGRFKNGREYMAAYPGAKVVDDNLAKLTAVTLENMIAKYGNKTGHEKWENYKTKQAETNSFEYKSKKYGWSSEQFDSYNKSRAITVENLVKKYGLEEGIKKWNEYCEKQRYTKSKEYVVQTYGEQAWINLCNVKRAPHSPQLLSATYGITYQQAVDKILSRTTLKYTSELEKEFILSIEAQLGSLDHTTISKPFGKWNHQDNSYVMYDIKHKDCIIEFNGDYWHANPSLYGSDDIIRGKLAIEIWERDKKKINLAISAGFRVKVVWESNYRKNKLQTIKDVVQWIQNTPE